MKPPAFQFYPADFMMGSAHMTAEEVGAYIRLLCFQWDRGSIPNDDNSICRLSGGNATAIPTLREKFPVGPDGLLRNVRLENERQKQRVFRDKQAENGAKRWVGNAKPHAVAMPSVMPNACSPSPSPSPSPIIQKEQELALPFASESFTQAWHDWMTYRAERKLPRYKATSFQANFTKLKEWGETGSIESIRDSIRNQWAGLFSPKTHINGKAPRPEAAVRYV